MIRERIVDVIYPNQVIRSGRLTKMLQGLFCSRCGMVASLVQPKWGLSGVICIDGAVIAVGWNCSVPSPMASEYEKWSEGE